MKNPKLIILALLMLAAFADGVSHQLTTPGDAFGPSDIVFAMIATLLIFIWYRLDSDEKSYRRTPFLSVSVVAVSVLAFPYYLYKSRGFCRGSVAVGLFLVCCAGYLVLQTAGQYAAYYAWQS
jgi:hypothetical protein